MLELAICWFEAFEALFSWPARQGVVDGTTDQTVNTVLAVDNEDVVEDVVDQVMKPYNINMLTKNENKKKKA